MKKILLAVIVIIAVSIGGSYILWASATDKVESLIAEHLKEQAAQTPGLNITYNVSKSGYPLHAKLDYSDIRISMLEPQTEETITAIVDAPIRIAASAFSPTNVEVSSGPTSVSFDIPEAMMEKMGPKDTSTPITLSVAWDKFHSAHDVTNLTSGTAEMLGLNVTVGAEAKPVVVTARRLYSERDININNNLSNGRALVQINDLTTRTAEHSLSISLYEMDLAVDNFPVAEEFQTFVQEMKAKPHNEKLTEAEFENMMGHLRRFVDDMVNNTSKLTINSFKIESGDTTFSLDGNLKVTPDALIDGGFDAEINGIQNMLAMLPAEHPARMMGGLGAMIGEEAIKASIAFRNGMIIFNGAPVMPIPPITSLLDHIKYPADNTKASTPTLNVPTPTIPQNMDTDTMPYVEDTEAQTDGNAEMPMAESLTEPSTENVIPEEVEEEASMPVADDAYTNDMESSEQTPEMSTTEEAEERVNEENTGETSQEEKPQYPLTKDDLSVTEEDLQKMLEDIDATLKETNLP